MILATVEKTPTSELTYTIDWTPWLVGGDTVATSVWTVPTGIANLLESNTTLKCSIKLGTATAGQTYDVKNSIITVGGLKDSRTLRFIIAEK